MSAPDKLQRRAINSHEEGQIWKFCQGDFKKHFENSHNQNLSLISVELKKFIVQQFSQVKSATVLTCET